MKRSANQSQSFAKIASGALQRHPAEDHVKKQVQKYPRSSNMPNLAVPKTKGPVTVDGSIQKVQTVVAKVVTILVPVIDIGNDQAGQTETYLKSFSM